MPRSAKLFFASILALGAAATLFSLFPFISENGARYLAFLAAAIVASGIRLSLPTVTGTLSINFIFVLIGVIALSRSETMLLGLLVTLIQCLVRPPRRPTPLQLSFNLANIAIAVTASYTAYHGWSFPDLSIDMPLRLLLASFVYYVLNAFPVAVAIALTEGKPIVSAWRECSLWSLPYTLIGAIAAGSFSFLKQAVGWPVLLLFVPFIYLLYRHYRLYIHRLADEKKHAEEVAGLHMRTVEALALAIAAKDHNSHDQLHRVQVLALALAEYMDLPPNETEAIRVAALLQDIGTLAVPDHILTKPTKLTREEMEKYKIHPTVGAEILERAKFPYPVAPIVRSHHEHWNGTGYPDGLRGDDIPIGARVLAVANSYEELTTRRGNRTAVAPWQAVEMLAVEAAVLFDPVVVETLEKHHAELDRRVAELRTEHHFPMLDLLPAEPPTLHPAKSKNPKAKSDTTSPTYLSAIASARQEAQSMFELAQELGTSLSLDETLSVFAMRLRRMVPYDAIAIFVRREELLRPEYVSGENSRVIAALEIPIGPGLSGWVAHSRRPILNGDPLQEHGYRELPGRGTLRSALSVPLEGVGGLAGVLTLYSVEPETFHNDHLRIVQALSAKVAMSIENALKYRQAESSASTDFLTGLLNARSLFLHLDSELARCRRSNDQLAILVSDLDGFKQVNDRFGHLEGNKLLQQVALRLKESCREYDCVARMGGDEFVIVLPGQTPDSVRKMIPRLRETVKEAGKQVLGEDVIGFSVGEAYFPIDGTDAEQLLAQADKRMYAFKAHMKSLKAAATGYDFDSRPAIY